MASALPTLDTDQVLDALKQMISRFEDESNKILLQEVVTERKDRIDDLMQEGIPVSLPIAHEALANFAFPFDQEGLFLVHFLRTCQEKANLKLEISELLSTLKQKFLPLPIPAPTASGINSTATSVV
eukprot:CAMPEP_0113943744 /NCGR_PEP_ID=MMETSP1339-20121228/27229_1 /TAXON_ID=94617 /ORGANISM="Fibrocapsa japonica" /LENGTH=126 /DNA_ID=CAMNT_0000948689 /DNA_START=31 /DNA_END=411 /DNA_ORIENTATION=+ /assembly_acc=CAM_ASM_000762